MKKSKKYRTVNRSDAERFFPEESVGLNEEQIKSRIEGGFINASSEIKSKSVFAIICGNLFTFFNFLGLVVFVALVLPHDR